MTDTWSRFYDPIASTADVEVKTLNATDAITLAGVPVGGGGGPTVHSFDSSFEFPWALGTMTVTVKIYRQDKLRNIVFDMTGGSQNVVFDSYAELADLLPAEDRPSTEYWGTFNFGDINGYQLGAVKILTSGEVQLYPFISAGGLLVISDFTVLTNDPCEVYTFSVSFSIP